MEIDKRSHERVKVDGDVRYSDALQTAEPHEHQKKHRGEIVDICPDGICIITKHEFERGSKVSFYILDHYSGIFTGIVRWCKKNTYDKFHVGLKVPFK